MLLLQDEEGDPPEPVEATECTVVIIGKVEQVQGRDGEQDDDDEDMVEEQQEQQGGGAAAGGVSASSSSSGRVNHTATIQFARITCTGPDAPVAISIGQQLVPFARGFTGVRLVDEQEPWYGRPGGGPETDPWDCGVTLRDAVRLRLTNSVISGAWLSMAGPLLHFANVPHVEISASRVDDFAVLPAELRYSRNRTDGGSTPSQSWYPGLPSAPISSSNYSGSSPPYSSLSPPYGSPTEDGSYTGGAWSYAPLPVYGVAYMEGALLVRIENSVCTGVAVATSWACVWSDLVEQVAVPEPEGGRSPPPPPTPPCGLNTTNGTVVVGDLADQLAACHPPPPSTPQPPGPSPPGSPPASSPSPTSPSDPPPTARPAPSPSHPSKPASPPKSPRSPGRPTRPRQPPPPCSPPKLANSPSPPPSEATPTPATSRRLQQQQAPLHDESNSDLSNWSSEASPPYPADDATHDNTTRPRTNLTRPNWTPQQRAAVRAYNDYVTANPQLPRITIANCNFDNNTVHPRNDSYYGVPLGLSPDYQHSSSQPPSGSDTALGMVVVRFTADPSRRRVVCEARGGPQPPTVNVLVTGSVFANSSGSTATSVAVLQSYIADTLDQQVRPATGLLACFTCRCP